MSKEELLERAIAAALIGQFISGDNKITEMQDWTYLSHDPDSEDRTSMENWEKISGSANVKAVQSNENGDRLERFFTIHRFDAGMKYCNGKGQFTVNITFLGTATIR